MASYRGKTRKQLLAQLQEEYARPQKIEFIPTSKYKDYLRRASFKCPKPRQIIARCDGKACPRRPSPCDKCTPIKSWNKVLRSKANDEIKDAAFSKLILSCKKCTVINRFLEESNYYDSCIRSRGARLQLYKVEQGEIIVTASGWGTQR